MRCPGCIPGRLSLGLLAVWVAALVILHAVELSQELHWWRRPVVWKLYLKSFTNGIKVQ